MTEYDALRPILASMVNRAVASAIANAPKWHLTQGSLIDYGSTSSLVVVDGDTDPIPVGTLLGWRPASGSRVTVLFIPNGGAFLIGAPRETRRPGFTVTDASLTLPNSVVTSANFDTVDRDTENFYDSSPGLILGVPFDGRWIITALQRNAAAGGARAFLDLVINGTFLRDQWNNENSAAVSLNSTFLATDSIEVQLFQTSGAPFATTVTVEADYLGPE